MPQGSILGSLLFLLYINGLPHCLSKTKPRLFADDTNLTASANSMTDLEAAVNSDLENLREPWLIANKLSHSVAKTEFILIGLKSMIKIFLIVRQYFNYCSEVWDVFGEAQSKRLQRLQYRSARIILNVNNDVEHTIALRAWGWEPLQMERKKCTSY